MDNDDALLRVRDLRTHFETFMGIVKALDGIEFRMSKGETLGLVGETGCGKSVTALSILKLIPRPGGKIISGEVWLDRENLTIMKDKKIRKVRGNKLSIIFQEPSTALNPVLKIGDQIAEVFMFHQNLDRDALETKIESLKRRKKQFDKRGLSFLSRIMRLEEKLEKLERMRSNPPKASGKDKKLAALKRAVEMLDLVGIPDPDKTVGRYPHELSGGMKQRVMIAMALACKPPLLIADEPTTSLDVTIQAQILELMKELRKNFESSILLITHHLGLVAEMCDTVAVMYAGRIVEYTDTKTLFENSMHPYTVGLLNAIPKISKKQERLRTIPGSVPDLINPPMGCRFHPRCKYSKEICRKEIPQMVEVEKNHFVSCFLFPDECHSAIL